MEENGRREAKGIFANELSESEQIRGGTDRHSLYRSDSFSFASFVGKTSGFFVSSVYFVDSFPRQRPS
jgi:hypothetical protein